MARSMVDGKKPCLFCDRAFRSVSLLTQHLDSEHSGWVETVMRKIGVQVPTVYPIHEYRRALARLFARLDATTD